MGGPHVAVLDQNPGFLEFMHQLLRDEGYQPLLCFEGDKAQCLLVQADPELIILDLSRMNLLETRSRIMQIRAHSVNENVPLLVCSSDHALLHIEQPFLHRMGCQTLGKPFDFEELCTIVRTMLERVSPEGVA